MVSRGPAMQDKVLQALIDSGEEATVILLNGFQMRCKVIDFDNFSVLFSQSAPERVHMIYKHAISTVTISPGGPALSKLNTRR